jgi:hypothetical protein
MASYKYREGVNRNDPVKKYDIEATLRDNFVENNNDIKNQYIINRPIKHINTNIQADSIDFLKDQRKGTGNFNIDRPAFLGSQIMPRVVDFDKLQLLDLETNGQKIQLSDKTLNELISVKVPDNTDVLWTREKARLITMYKARGMTDEQIDRELEVNKPLGREQRFTMSKRNVMNSEITLGQKINELKQEVMDGRAEGQLERAQILGQLAILLQNVNNVERLTDTEFKSMAIMIARLRPPANHVDLGLPVRMCDGNYYTANAGLINLYIFSRIIQDPAFNRGPDFDYLRPIKNWAAYPQTGLPAITLSSMKSGLSGKGLRQRFLDIDQLGIIDTAQLNGYVQGIAGGMASPTISITLNPP